jgi:hypothetical protein
MHIKSEIERIGTSLNIEDRRIAQAQAIYTHYIRPLESDLEGPDLENRVAALCLFIAISMERGTSSETKSELDGLMIQTLQMTIHSTPLELLGIEYPELVRILQEDAPNPDTIMNSKRELDHLDPNTLKYKQTQLQSALRLIWLLNLRPFRFSSLNRTDKSECMKNE